MLDTFPEVRHDFEIAVLCDMILDIFRYKNKEIIAAIDVISDYKTSIKKG